MSTRQANAHARNENQLTRVHEHLQTLQAEQRVVYARFLALQASLERCIVDQMWMEDEEKVLEQARQLLVAAYEIRLIKSDSTADHASRLANHYLEIMANPSCLSNNLSNRTSTLKSLMSSMKDDVGTGGL